MKLALFGAGGTIGRRILNEALDRGHHVTAVVRDPDSFTDSRANLKVVRGDIFDPDSVASAAQGQDAVVSAYGPGMADPQLLVRAANSLIEGVRRAGGVRLISVGGAGSLEVAPGVRLVDAPNFPVAWRGMALAHADALETYRLSDANWTLVSPAALIEPGERTGKFRVGRDQLLTDAKGESRISAEDYAIAMIDELEQPRHLRARFTVAY